MLQLPQPLAQALVNYLVKQRYKDVAGLVAELAKLKPVPAAGSPSPVEDGGGD